MEKPMQTKDLFDIVDRYVKPFVFNSFRLLTTECPDEDKARIYNMLVNSLTDHMTVLRDEILREELNEKTGNV